MALRHAPELLVSVCGYQSTQALLRGGYPGDALFTNVPNAMHYHIITSAECIAAAASCTGGFCAMGNEAFFAIAFSVETR